VGSSPTRPTIDSDAAPSFADRNLGRGFSQADRNGDGYLDNGEYSSRSQSGSDRSDSNSTTSDESSTNNPSPSNSPSGEPRD
jgi:hypothetical protein